MKHQVVRRLLILLLACWTLIFGSCALFRSDLKKPKVDLEKVHFEQATFTDALLVFSLRVENPNDFPLKIDALNYDLKVNDKDFGAGKIQKEVTLASLDKTIVELPLRVKFKDLFGSIAEMLQKDKSSYQIQGSLSSGFISIPFDEKGEVEVPRPKL